MRALCKKAPGPGFEFCDVPTQKLGASDVLIRVEKAGICGSDLHI